MKSDLSFYWPFVKLGVTDVWRHKTRSFLTMLGLVFGVGSVIAMLAVGEGASQQALESIKRLGSENILVSSVKPVSDSGNSMSAAKQASLSVYGLLFDDALRIRETVPGVADIVPARMVRRDARFHERGLELRVVETLPTWFEVVKRPLLAGRTLTAQDEHSKANVCVLTEFGVRKLLSAEKMIGQHIRIGNGVLEVVGIVKNEEGGNTRAPDSDADAYIPMATGSKLFGIASLKFVSGSQQGEKVELSQIIVRMKSTKVVEAGAKAVEAVLKRFHKKPDYRIDVPLSLLREAERTKRTYNVVLGAIAGISLLVGGIGIMNIMLVSVTERIKEIGLRMSIGATPRNILTQFILEAIVLATVGGAAGVATGVGASVVVGKAAGWPVLVEPLAAVYAFLISTVVGLFFGFYPAYRASKLNPIDCLRYE